MRIDSQNKMLFYIMINKEKTSKDKLSFEAL